MLTLTYLTWRSNFRPNAFKLAKKRKFDFLNTSLLRPFSYFSLDMLNAIRQWVYIGSKGQG